MSDGLHPQPPVEPITVAEAAREFTFNRRVVYAEGAPLVLQPEDEEAKPTPP